MSATQTEIRGLVGKEIEVLQQKRALLEKAGLKVDQLEETLTRQLADAVAEDARQDFLRSESKKSTVRVTAAYDLLYETASGLLDAMMGVIGKNSEDAKAMQAIRSAVRRPRDPTAESDGPVEPRPAP